MALNMTSGISGASSTVATRREDGGGTTSPCLERHG
jgi:hypothetical protein